MTCTLRTLLDCPLDGGFGAAVIIVILIVIFLGISAWMMK